jgi:SNF2 family DNA or RNA helicase
VIAQCGVAQYGVTLTAAETSIFYSQNFSVEERMQAEDRNHRIGTTSPVRYIDLIMRDSVDKSIAETLKRKKKLASSITSMEVKNLIVGEV